MSLMPGRLSVVVVMAAIIAGCKVGPEYRRPDATPPKDFRSQVASTEAGSMIAGALAFCAYAYVCCYLLAKRRLSAAAVSIGGLGLWLIVALSAWLLVLKQ